MRFCHPSTLTAGSRDAKQASPSHRRIDPKSSVQRDQTHFIVFSLRTIFLRQIARPTLSLENLTEFPFGPNFSKPDLEGL
jgi:hypothetical protein